MKPEMKKTYLAVMMVAALALMATTANAAPKLPESFHGQWCEKGDSELERCSENDGGLVIGSRDFGADDFNCHLVHLTLQKKPVPRDEEDTYRATFQCVGGGSKVTNYRRYYWIGFIAADHRNLFMIPADSTFTQVQK
jgi:hypothetical protein